MRVLFLAAEAAPHVKIGGLADVAGELPRALRDLGLDVRLALPRHPALSRPSSRPISTAAFEVKGGERLDPAQVEVFDVDGLATWFINGPPIASSPSVYGEAIRDVDKYTFFSLAALVACERLEWIPDVVHAHDWHASPVLVDLRRRRTSEERWRATAGVLTIHNLAFMGQGGEASLKAWGVGLEPVASLPTWAQGLPLPLGLASADRITAVSPGYAREIMTPEFGCGLEGFLANRADRLTGILNGLDHARWDPSNDACLFRGYSRDEVVVRGENKAQLIDALGLEGGDDPPLVAMISRLDRQKGVDLALTALAALADRPWRFILLGSGDAALEGEAREFAAAYTGRVHLALRFDEALARRIYAGADILLVPSRYEPCGLTQLIGMRYGAIPVARATGGLKDTVLDDDAGEGTGFLFDEASPQALAQAVLRAFEAFGDRGAWRRLQRRAMSADHGWERPAQMYRQVYAKAVAGG